MFSYICPFLIGIVFFLSPALADKLINVRQAKLSNGLQVMVIENHRLPIVSFRIWYRVGSADDPVGKSGLAHLAEHVLVQFGTKSLPSHGEKGVLTKKIASLGGEENASTTRDWTCFSTFIAKEHLEFVFDLHAQRMRDLEFHQALFDSEKKVVLEERSMQVDNNPVRKLREITARMLYFHHPYGVPVIGWRHEIETLTLEDLRAYYERWYHPDNAVIIIEGDTTLEESRALAEKYFARIPLSPHSLKREWISMPPRHKVVTRTTLEEVGIGLGVTRAYLTEGANKGYREALAKSLLAFILGDQDYGRLSRLLIEEHKIGQDAAALYDEDSRGPTSFLVVASLKEKQDLEYLEALIDVALREMILKGPSEEELEVAKRMIETDILFVKDRFGGMAELVGRSLMAEQPLEEVQDTLTLLRTITIDEVQRAAKTLFSRSPDVQAISLPISQPKE